jgi:plastocyanin
MRIRVGLCLLGVLASVLLGVAPAWAQTAAVSATDNEFSPEEIEVEAGTTITWTNNGDAPHTVTADNGSFESGNMDPGDEFSETFSEQGRYPYYCEYHGAPDGQGMSGVVVVSGGGNGGNGGDGNGGGNGDDAGGTDDTGTGAGADATDDGDLPTTGTAVDAFVFLALALIASGGILMKLGAPLGVRR